MDRNGQHDGNPGFSVPNTCMYCFHLDLLYPMQMGLRKSGDTHSIFGLVHVFRPLEYQLKF